MLSFMLRNWTLSVPSSSHLCNGQRENTYLRYDFASSNYAFQTMFQLLFSFRMKTEAKKSTHSLLSLDFLIQCHLWCDHFLITYWRCGFALFRCVCWFIVVFLNEWIANKKSTLKRSSSVRTHTAQSLTSWIRTRARFLARLECENCVFQRDIPFHKPHSVTRMPFYS